MMTCCAVGRLDALEYLLLPHNIVTESPMSSTLSSSHGSNVLALKQSVTNVLWGDVDHGPFFYYKEARTSISYKHYKHKESRLQ